jgi:signal peptidase I
LIEGGDPKAGDVVVFQAWKSAVSEFASGNNYFIKRIVGVPGDTVEVHNYEVYVNGRKQPEVDFAVEDSFQDRQVERIKTYGPLKLAAGQYFVLGDNRSNSQDSRYYGPIDRADISGRAELVYWSWVRNQGSLDIAIGRIGLPIE